MTRFGPAGNSESFTGMGYKKTEQVPEYLERMGLNAFEYQCGRGVRITTQAANRLGALARERDIQLSVHAPYYISLSSLEEEKRLGSIRYILESARAARDLGGNRIVIHSGSCSKLTRQQALELAVKTMDQAVQALDENGYSDIIPCPETMGKVNQLGTLEEVLALCQVDERMLPCIDFGHLNARTFGGIKGGEDYRAILDAVENAVGIDRARVFHSHFSKIQYTEKGGEKMHLTFADQLYGPEFEPLANLIVQRGYHPVFICESAGTQAEDAAAMRAVYRALGGE